MPEDRRPAFDRGCRAIRRDSPVPVPGQTVSRAISTSRSSARRWSRWRPRSDACGIREANEAGFEVMLQEFIPGDSTQGVNYNSYSWGGRHPGRVHRCEDKECSARHGVSLLQRECDTFPRCIEPGRRILRAMDFDGYACTEFKRDPRDGVYKLMEVNGRHNLSSLLAVRCGVNFPWIHYEHLVHGKQPSAHSYRDGRVLDRPPEGHQRGPGVSHPRESLCWYSTSSRTSDLTCSRVPDRTDPEAVPQAVRAPGQRRLPAASRILSTHGAVPLSVVRFRGRPCAASRSLSPPEPFLKHRTGSGAHRGRTACRTSSSSTCTQAP